MSTSGSWVWAFYIGMSSLLSLFLGLALGYILFSPNAGNLQVAKEPVAVEMPTAIAEESVEPVEETPASEPAVSEEPIEADEAELVAVERVVEPELDLVQAARHLFIAVNGQWLADGTRTFLEKLQPGGVVLRPGNIASEEQTRALITEIKYSSNRGSLFSDLPLIAMSQDGNQGTLLRLPDATPAVELGASNDVARAKQLGRQYGTAAKAFGINVILGPTLDVYDPSTAFPNLRTQSFGTNQTQVSSLGLSMVQGMRESGVISVAKSFPGYAAAGYSSDGISVVMNQDYNGLAKAMYPFNEATRSQVEGIVVGHIAVPLIDKDFPTRSAALSPLMVTELLRKRWAFQGVIIADEIAFNEMTRARPAERAVVEALIAGCDVVIFLDPNPARILAVVEAIDRAVEQGELTIEQLDASKARLEQWRLTLGAVPPAPPEPVNTQMALLQDLAGESGTGSVMPEVTISEPVAVAAPEPEDPSTAEPVISEQQPTSETPDLASAPEVVEPSVASLETLPTSPELEKVVPMPIEAPVIEETISAETEIPEPEAEIGAAPVDSEPEPMPAEPVAEPEPVVEPEPNAVVMIEEESTPEPVIEEVPVDTPEPVTEETENGVPDTIEELANAVDDSVLNQVQHTVKEGDSLLQVAWEYDVTTDDILRWNSLKSMTVDAGTVLDIYIAQETSPVEEAEKSSEPTAEELALQEKISVALIKMNEAYQRALARSEAKNAEAAEPDKNTEDIPEAPTDSAVEESPAVVVPEQEPTPEKPVGKMPAPTEFKFVHQVKWGDTLSSIASDYSVSVSDIRSWNKLKSDTLQANTSLLIYVDSASRLSEKKSSASQKAENVTTYVVKSGDTISNIARKHNTTLDKIMSLNKLKNANNIFVGQKLKVPSTQ